MTPITHADLISIRRAIPADLEAIDRIEQRCFGASGDAFSARQLDYQIHHASGGCYVACAATEVVGYLSLLTRSNSRRLRIYSVAVDPDARGQGIGQALVGQAIVRATELRLTAITLEVRTDNAAAIALYRRNGFQTDGTLSNYYHDGTDALRMRLEL